MYMNLQRKLYEAYVGVSEQRWPGPELTTAAVADLLMVATHEMS
jgi:hypothetical protein